MKLVTTAFLVAMIFIAGCATSISHDAQTSSEHRLWHGRLAVHVPADPGRSPARHFAGEFALSGNAMTGRLDLYTPLGITVASLSWTPSLALLRSEGDVHSFGSLEALVRQTLGTELPVGALFGWLAGESTDVAGWSVDLSEQSSGRITARQTEPHQAAEIRLIIEP